MDINTTINYRKKLISEIDDALLMNEFVALMNNQVADNVPTL